MIDITGDCCYTGYWFDSGGIPGVEQVKQYLTCNHFQDEGRHSRKGRCGPGQCPGPFGPQCGVLPARLLTPITWCQRSTALGK